jgi:hypothetical protein
LPWPWYIPVVSNYHRWAAYCCSESARNRRWRYTTLSHSLPAIRDDYDGGAATLPVGKEDNYYSSSTFPCPKFTLS